MTAVLVLLGVVIGALLVGKAFERGQQVQSASFAERDQHHMQMAELQAETTIRLAGLAHQGRPRPRPAMTQVAPAMRVYDDDPLPAARPVRSITGRRRPTA